MDYTDPQKSNGALQEKSYRAMADVKKDRALNCEHFTFLWKYKIRKKKAGCVWQSYFFVLFVNRPFCQQPSMKFCLSSPVISHLYYLTFSQNKCSKLRNHCREPCQIQWERLWAIPPLLATRRQCQKLIEHPTCSGASVSCRRSVSIVFDSAVSLSVYLWLLLLFWFLSYFIFVDLPLPLGVLQSHYATTFLNWKENDVPSCRCRSLQYPMRQL